MKLDTGSVRPNVHSYKKKAIFMLVHLIIMVCNKTIFKLYCNFFKISDV